MTKRVTISLKKLKPQNTPSVCPANKNREFLNGNKDSCIKFALNVFQPIASFTNSLHPPWMTLTTKPIEDMLYNDFEKSSTNATQAN